ncbi:acetyl-CoA C-acetyltransferase [Actinoplanes lutulentus]|uniref:Acetyl-CoA C-acetyltransferase n=1 Tax=Actinoplanes lutulentus TaxID=1287878 RepID=A0A327Z8P0_9ACTN|nr:acetyl-CoA acetyltransferase [Actinoplanes lutulentus]MBB2947752.1 acetyl-CoA C-acetyltransferase [Actinoplanes lutulentus]RAK29934.1 acetyl-CoA C-acetyltransferase [Actinoplanes lutulentus]
MHLDPRTPILVGVGQTSELLDSPDYRRRSPVELAADAARAALADTGADPAAVIAAVDTVATTRQFENSLPGARAPLGRSDNFPRSVAQRLGAHPARAVLDVTGGHTPQRLVNEFAAAIAAGNHEVVLLSGSEAISTILGYAQSPARPDFSEHVDGDLEDRGFGLDGLLDPHTAAHGLTDTTSQYALFDNARRARLKLSREDYATAMGELFAPFTRVAAANPHAAAPVERSAAELVTPTEANRPIADPYTRYVVARDKVNQGAAIVLMSVAAATRLGVPSERWVYLAGHADLRERDLMDRADLSASPASVMAARHALEVAGIGFDSLEFVDLYSCYPIPVFTIADAFGLTADDRRGLTVTGGLPFFGGAGNNYSMHAIASVVSLVRGQPGSCGFVGANGGVMSKYSAGVYTAAPTPWRADDSAALQAEIDAWAAPEQAFVADGWAVVETYTVKHGRDGSRTGVVIGRLEADDRRFIAVSDADLLGGAEPIGTRVFVRSVDGINRVSVV